MNIINLKGIKYRIQRCFGLTDYDREQRKKKKKTHLSVTEDLIDSLKILPLHDLPVRISARVVYVIYFLLVCALAFFFFQGYYTARTEKFLALSSSAGVCETVPKVISGTYKFDVDGNWEGSKDFSVSKSIYSLTLSHLQFTNEDFIQLSQLAITQLDHQYYEVAAIHTLALNLVFWMSWAINTVESANVQQFQLTGDAKTLYNQGTAHVSGMSSLGPGRCDVSSSITFEKASGVYRILYSYQEFIQSEACMQVADPRSLNFDPDVGSDDFILEFDVQSVMTVLGVNYGIIDFGELKEVPYTRDELVINDVTYQYAHYYNSRYPNMEPILCFPRMNTTSPSYEYDRVDSCSIELGMTPLYPVFNHIGYSPAGQTADGTEGRGGVETQYCSCSEEVMSDSKLSSQCESFLMMTGFIFYRGDYESDLQNLPQPVEKMFQLLQTMYPEDEGKFNLNVDAYNISKEAIHFAGEDYFNSSARESYYDFCVVDGTPCSIITIYTDSNQRHGVSEDYYQIKHGHCNDTVTVSEESQEKFSISPTPLTENYLECRRTFFAAIIASGGIAVGNVLSVKSALVLLFSFWLARYTAKSTGSGSGESSTGTENRDKSGRVQYATYGVVERDKVLQYLAFNLLLVRDGNYEEGDISDMSDSSLVRELAKELETHPYLKRFFCVDVNEVGDEVVVDGENEHVNPMQQGMSEDDDIELKTTADSTKNSEFNSGEGSFWSNFTASFTRRNEHAFEEEVLPNPMYLKES